MVTASRGSVGITPTCRGMAPSYGWRHWTAKAGSVNPLASLAVSTNPSFNPNGRRMAHCTLSPTAVAGGTFIAGAMEKPRLCCQSKRSLDYRNGGLACLLTDSPPTTKSPAHIAALATLSSPPSTPLVVSRQRSKRPIPVSVVYECRPSTLYL